MKVLLAVVFVAGAMAAPVSEDKTEAVEQQAVAETSDSSKDLQTAEGHLGAYGGHGLAGYGNGYGLYGAGYGGLGYGYGTGYGAGYGGKRYGCFPFSFHTMC